MGIIYLLTAPTEQIKGKKEQYIGQSVQTFEERWSHHKSKARCNSTGGCRKLNAYLRKYDPDNFQKEILLECPDEMLNYYETKFIALYDTLDPNGLNLTTGGDSGNRKSASTKKLMSESAIKRDSSVYRKSEETKGFPRYMQYTARNNKPGYCISKYPGYPDTYFVKKSQTLAQNEADCRAFLDRLNAGERPSRKKVRNLPEYIHLIENGYKVAYKSKSGKIIQRYSINSNISMDQKLQKAIETLEQLKAADV